MHCFSSFPPPPSLCHMSIYSLLEWPSSNPNPLSKLSLPPDTLPFTVQSCTHQDHSRLWIPAPRGFQVQYCCGLAPLFLVLFLSSFLTFYHLTFLLLLSVRFFFFFFSLCGLLWSLLNRLFLQFGTLDIGSSFVPSHCLEPHNSNGWGPLEPLHTAV